MKNLDAVLSDFNHDKVILCAVTKHRSIADVEVLLNRGPRIKNLAENRWPDCEEKFRYFAGAKFSGIKKHFIGPLQSNKVRKVLPLVDSIQSVDSLKLLSRINKVATELDKKIEFCFQVNISQDQLKQGIAPDQLSEIIKGYLDGKEKGELEQVQLVGLMTIGAQTNLEKRQEYFQKFHQLFTHINQDFFPNEPLKILSMGMSEDYQLAIDCGSSMVRLGRVLFEDI